MAVDCAVDLRGTESILEIEIYKGKKEVNPITCHDGTWGTAISTLLLTSTLDRSG